VLIRSLFQPFITFDGPNEGSGGGIPDPPVPSDVAPAAPTTPPPAAPAPLNPGPWAQDLAAAFPDEVLRGQVDTFLRGHVQPRVTQIEQEYAPAKELWTDLQKPEESAATYLAVAEQLYGEEFAEKLAETMVASGLIELDEEPPAASQQALPPEVQRAVEFVQKQEMEQQWQAGLAAAAAAEPSIQGHERLFANFVAGSGGNFETAIAAWKHEQMPARLAATLPEAPAPTPAPTALAGGAAPAGTPPVEKKYASIDAALDDFFAEQRAGEAPPVMG